MVFASVLDQMTYELSQVIFGAPHPRSAIEQKEDNHKSPHLERGRLGDKVDIALSVSWDPVGQTGVGLSSCLSRRAPWPVVDHQGGSSGSLFSRASCKANVGEHAFLTPWKVAVLVIEGQKFKYSTVYT